MRTLQGFDSFKIGEGKTHSHLRNEGTSALAPMGRKPFCGYIDGVAIV